MSFRDNHMIFVETETMEKIILHMTVMAFFHAIAGIKEFLGNILFS